MATAAVALALTPSEAWAKGGQWGPLEGKASSDSAFSLHGKRSERDGGSLRAGCWVKKGGSGGYPRIPSGKLT